MLEYVERDALMEEFRTYMAENFDREKCVSAENCEACERKCLWHRVVMKAPAADVAPVVRCKDCKRMNEDKLCVAWEGFVREDDFCSYGVRKDGDGDG